jgi:ketosteroid isomerase-like protein
VPDGKILMNIDKNIRAVKDFFAAISRGDKEALLAVVAEDIEWIIPGEDWPLAGIYHGHAGLADLLETASRSIETSTERREFIAQGTAYWSSASPAGRSKLRTRHLSTIGSSPLLSGTAS